MSGLTRPWVGWIFDYPDEGCVWVDAPSKSAALKKVAQCFSEPVSRVVARPATASDGDALLEEIDRLTPKLPSTPFAAAELAPKDGQP